MLGVVPREEPLAEGPRVLDRAEQIREAGPVLEGLEVGLGIRIVVARVRPAVALDDAEVGKQERDRLGVHRAAPIGVGRERVPADSLLDHGVGDEPSARVALSWVATIQPGT